MRPKFVFALLLLALLVLGAAFLLKQHWENAGTPPPVTESVTPAPVVSVAPPPAPAPAVTAPVAANTLTPEQRQAAIDAETDRLQDWSMNNDPASLSNILADLTNPEKEIREAAIEAAKQFDSTNAIPVLKAVAANTTDTEEQIALLEAANFLSLPSLPLGTKPAQTREQMKATAQQARQAHQNKLQQGAQSQNPSSGTQSSPDQNAPAGPNQ